MADAPHITIGLHPQAGVVAAPSDGHHLTDHLLRRVDFEPVPDSRLYALTEPDRDPIRRTQLAVQSLRVVRQKVTADAAFDLHPGERLPSTSGPGQEPQRQAALAEQRRARVALATSPAHARTTSELSLPIAEPAYRPAPAAAPQPARAR